MKIKINQFGAFFSCIFILLVPNLSNSQVLINELVSSNSAGVSDPDFDETADWIELFNKSSEQVDLSGYFLTDNLGNSDKWQFPEGTQIEANDHLLIWADGENTGLHCSFKLTKDGEQVGLYDPLGNILDSVIYSNQQTDVSYGRETDGADEWGFFTAPTPSESNTETPYDGIVFYRPTFSIKGGFYSESILVEINTIDGDIRYTIDGSFPTLNSPLYSEALLIEETTILRARIFVNNFISGKAGTESYFIDENLEARKLPIVSIATNDDYFWDPDIGLYMQDFKPDWKYPINIELFENDGGNRAVFNELGAVKVNGQNSWELPQKMLGIYFDNEYDNNNLEYPLFFDRRRNKFDNFTLRVGGSDWSSTMFRDGLCQGLTRGRMNLSSMGFRSSIVFVNGEYLGVHNMRSRIDEGFIEENYGLAGNEYDLIENNGDVEQGDDVAYQELFELLDQDLSIQSNFDAVAAIMDIENYMHFYITEIWASNSSYGHNIQLWKPKAEGSKWRWIAQDFDRGFSGSDNDLIERFSTDAPNNYEWVASRFANMLENEGFADSFMRLFADHLYTTFHPDRVLEHIDEKEQTLEAEMPIQIDKWLGTTSGYGDALPSFDYWKDEVEELRLFAQERQAAIFADLIDNFEVNETTTLGVLTDEVKGGTTYINDLSIPSPNWAGMYLKDLSFNLTARANPGYDFLGWSKDSLNILIAKESQWKYYDQGDLPADNWKDTDYNDVSWNEGQAQLGYGDNDENTVIDFGNNADNKHITTLFRKTVVIPDLSQIIGQARINLLRDDGAVVYVNGQEVIRSNMPSGDITIDIEASDFVAGNDEETYNLFSIDLDAFKTGENVIAVEIHQVSSNSSDISFDLELAVIVSGDQNIFSVNETIPVQLNSEAFYVAHYLANTDCLLADTIASDMTLVIDCSPYLARKSVMILPGVSLSVEEGVEIYFLDNEGLIIKGDLQVLGSEDQAVRFLPNYAAGATMWSNLYFDNATDTSSLNWLEIKGASRGLHPIKEDAAIASWKSSIEMNHVTLMENYQNPILARHSDIWLRNSQLHSIVTGDLINVKYGYGFIDGCEFRGNDQVDTDAIDYDQVVDGVIQNSKIYDFEGFNSDGIDLGEESENILIENNFIHHITDKGISVGQQSTIQMIGNTVVECNQGLGIKDEGMAFVDQNTFYNNAFDIVAFEKNVGKGGGHLQIINSIFSNTAYDPITADETSSYLLEYSLSDTKELDGFDLIFEDPSFENPTQNDFHLMGNSPAINGGFDSNGSIIDLGAKSHLYSAKGSLLISGIHYNPLDDPDKEFLQIYNPSTESNDISYYEISDGVFFIFPTGTIIEPGETIHLVKDILLYPDLAGQVFEWTSGKLANGGEQLILKDPYGIILDHVTYSFESPWPTLADGGGGYLKLIDSDLDNHFGKNWIGELANPTRINEVNSSRAFKISPNPTEGFIEILSLEDRIKTLAVFDAYGRECEKISVDQSSAKINLQALPSGIYYLVINDVDIKKVVKI